MRFGLLPLLKYEKLLAKKPENFWQKIGEKNALNIFKQAANLVPAYKNFLKKNKIDYSKIKTIKDFGLIPPTDKKNYIQNYELKDLNWNGNLQNANLVASSSGTSGNPNYWPRSTFQEQEAILTHELLFKNLFEIDKHSTLAIIGFPMGVYVSGIATLLPSLQIANKYNLSIVSCGNNKNEVLKAIKTLGKNFDQILLIGHPFFLKDVLESGTSQGINWTENKISLMFCSEGFSEEWREYVLKEAGLKNARAFNTYGSSEMLLMAYETPGTIAAKKLMENNSAQAHAILGVNEPFNIFQYNPAFRFIEEEQNELLFTSNSGLPLIRFNLHDRGKILSGEKITRLLNIKKPHWNLPFLALYGRSDYAVIFYAANIYPAHIHRALGKKVFLKKITGKFAMNKGYMKNMDEFLVINIELREKIKNSGKLRLQLRNQIFKTLLDTNSEISDAFKRFGKKIIPVIKLWPYGHEKYFKPGLKPKYIA